MRFGKQRWIGFDWGMLVVRSDDYRAFSIAKTSGTQKGTIKTWKNLASLKPNLIVDVGANYGEFSAAIAELGISTLVVEANPWIADCLKLTFESKQNVSVINAAITDTDGEMPFYFNRGYSGISSLSKKVINANWFWGGVTQVQRVTVKTYKLDSLVYELHKTPKSMVLKIDVEGFEFAVIKGALSLLNKCDWWRALLEFHPGGIIDAGYKVEEVWQAYRNFKGLVLDQNVVRLEDVQNLCTELPKMPPLYGCDILIGKGCIY